MKKFKELSLSERVLALQIFNELLQNEQQKAQQAVAANLGGHPFGGTSVTAVIRTSKLDQPLELKSMDELAEAIAKSYIKETREIEPLLERGFTRDEVALYNKHGIFYSIHVSPKLIALVEGLHVRHKDLLLDGFPDPYGLPKEPRKVQDAYFLALKEQRNLDLDIQSLVLADTTTPPGYEGKKILNPKDLNAKLSKLSKIIGDALDAMSMHVDPLHVIATDSDSPHRTLICQGLKPTDGFPLTPGLTLCGSTATMEGFDLKYLYRIGLIAQILSGNIIGSRVAGEYDPFMFTGMLSPFGYTNGAIDAGNMGALRYEGDIDLRKEFFFQYDRDIHRLMPNGE